MSLRTAYIANIKLPKQFEIDRVSYFMDETIQWITAEQGINGVIFDFNGVKWISAEGIVALSTVIKALLNRGYTVDFELPKNLTAPVAFCNDCDFFRIHFQKGIDVTPRLRNTSFPITLLSAKTFNQQYIDNLIAWLKSSCGRQYSFGMLDTSLDEIFNNIIDHSKSKTGGVIFAQHYPLKGYIEVSISDNGIGIAQKIRNTYAHIKTANRNTVLK